MQCVREKAVYGRWFRDSNAKKPLSFWNSGFFLKLVANQGFEPRTCGL
jgi:hypothetical protein